MQQYSLPSVAVQLKSVATKVQRSSKLLYQYHQYPLAHSSPEFLRDCCYSRNTLSHSLCRQGYIRIAGA
jgi:hypothetical protein